MHKQFLETFDVMKAAQDEWLQAQEQGEDAASREAEELAKQARDRSFKRRQSWAPAEHEASSSENDLQKRKQATVEQAALGAAALFMRRPSMESRDSRESAGGVSEQEPAASSQDGIDKEKRVEHLTQMAVRRMGKKEISRGFEAWADMYFEEQRRKRLLVAVGAKLAKPKLSAGYARWRHDWEANGASQEGTGQEQGKRTSQGGRSQSRGSSKGASKVRPRRMGISAESGGRAHHAGGDGGDGAALGAAAGSPKSEEARALILSAVTESALFAGCSAEQRERLVDVMQELTVSAGEMIIHEGEEGQDFYVVGSGEYVVLLVKAGETPVHTFREGGMFGELALLYNQPRAASVRCEQAGSLFALDRMNFQAVLRCVADPVVESALDKQLGLLRRASAMFDGYAPHSLDLT